MTPLSSSPVPFLFRTTVKQNETESDFLISEDGCSVLRAGSREVCTNINLCVLRNLVVV